MRSLFFALLFATSLSARPVITAVSPSSGPTAGGTVVTITGSGFRICEPCQTPVPPSVMFGGTPARSVTLVDENTLRVVTPAHLPKTVPVAVLQPDGLAVQENAFTFSGPIEDGFERVLLPIYDFAEGAFGSRFFPALRVANPSSTERAWLLGLETQCIVTCIGVDPLEQPYELEPGPSHRPEAFSYGGRPGLFVYLPHESPRVIMNLRVFDDSRRALNFGTEIPVVSEREFTREPFRLLGVPLDPRFRTTLRVYAASETSVTATINEMIVRLDLAPGENLLYPAYAQFGNFPIGTGKINVTVTPSSVPVWAFISVTNNDTQLITTITPQR